MKKILIDATGSSSWIGGVYHKKNILFSLLENEWITANCRIVLVTNNELLDLFKEFEDRITIKTISYKGIRDKKLKLSIICLLNRIGYAFPNPDNRICRFLHLKGINWVPDYQHYHFREFFSEEEYSSRRNTDVSTYETVYPLVLSSYACLDDFRKYCSKDKQNVYVVPFVSYIESEIRGIDDDYLKSVCDKYGIAPFGYIMTANQFWKHKNHKVVLEALRLISDKMEDGAKIVFTGQLSDYRDGGYIDSIRDLLASEEIAPKSICTGFIDRREQLALMKGARFLIQPSLFEGWGTVLEDAKVLDKSVLLSDIPVHREQQNDKCTLFDPYDADDLGQLILDKWKDAANDDMESGIRNMRKSAKQYSMEFERLLKEN